MVGVRGKSIREVYESWPPHPWPALCPCGSFEFGIKTIHDYTAEPAVLYYLVLECLRCGAQYIVGPGGDRLVIQPFNSKALRLKKEADGL